VEQLVLSREGRRRLGRDRFSLVMKNRRAGREKIPTRKTDVWATPPFQRSNVQVKRVRNVIIKEGRHR